MAWNKKGDKPMIEPPSGGAAASVLAIVTLILVLFIVFLPAEDRARLLDDDDDRLSDPDFETNVTLFSESIGTLAAADEPTSEHTIPNTVLVETRNAVTLAEYNPFAVRNGWFTTQKEVLTFHIDEPQIVDDVVLSFDVGKTDGLLTVELNGRLIFEGVPRSANVGPVRLRSDFLKRDNELVFAVDGVGLAFWKTNLFTIENVRVVGDVTDEATQESINTFVLAESELEGLERATLDYFPNCASTGGTLDIFLNGRRVASGVPDCQSPNRHELDIEDLQEGKNSVLFRIDRGSYLLEQIRVKLELKEPVPFVEFFDVSEDDFTLLRRGHRAHARIHFVDDDDRDKRGILKINDRSFSIQQTDDLFERDVSRYLVEDENSFQILPENTLHIVKFELVIE